MAGYLREQLSFDRANMVIESISDNDNKKSLYMKGIFIQGDVRNHNQRVYPSSEIKVAVNTLNQQITSGYSVWGELDHPDDVKINLDRASHMITKMWMDGPDGYGQLKIIPTPMGEIVRVMIESGGKLGVSSRGTGDVDDLSGKVSGFEITTVDIVAQPSAPDAYPRAIYESLMNMKYGHRVPDMAKDALINPNMQKFLKTEVIRLINELKVK
jgi:hypothetical protein